ncbi:hypothetical protein D3C80_435290 [compost metagenome]
MLIVGSKAAAFWNIDLGRPAGDFDAICTFSQFNKWYKDNKGRMVHAVPTNEGRYYHCVSRDGFNYEFELAWPGTSAEAILNSYPIAAQGGVSHAQPWDLLMIKCSHRFKRNSPHFLKTMKDIKVLLAHEGYNGIDSFLSSMGDGEKQLYRLRESESYNYAHPKLDVSKEDFFKGDGVDYVYDHDSIHLAVALMTDFWESHTVRTNRPAYTGYMKDGSEVMTSSEKFWSVSEETRLYGVYEETCVLALERSQIPHGLGKEGGPTARWSFETALMKVCTSITSGWFRNYAYNNYDKVLDLYEQMGENDYLERFERNAHLLKPFKG